MTKWFSSRFWEQLANKVLRNRVLILAFIVLFTIFMAFQWQKMRFTYTEANLLPAHHEINKQYNAFLDKFGEEGNLIVLGIESNELFNQKSFLAWQKLMKTFQNHSDEIELVISIESLKVLQKNDSLQRFEMTPFIEKSKLSEAYLKEKQQELSNDLPFYEGMLFAKKTGSVRAALYMNKSIVNTPKRKGFVMNVLIPAVETFEKETNIDVKVSGMPYIRTLNANSIVSEIGLFIGAALAITSLIFFFFFRSFRATIISMVVVTIGVMWAFGTLGFLNYEITVLTAVIPPLIIVIGIPNCIFLINKYQQEYKNHGNQAKALVRVITKIGAATLMTNLTTAAGFATFMITDSNILKEFGTVAAINILFLFVLCLLIIPILYSYMGVPKDRHLAHLGKNYMKRFLEWIEHTIKNHHIAVYGVTISLLILGIIGIFQIKISGSIIEDMPKKAPFFKDILYFEENFNGVMPLEIVIDTKRKKGVLKPATIRRMEQLNHTIEEIPELSKPISIVNILKYATQTYYNGNPEYYALPTSQEQAFVLTYLKNSMKNKGENMLKSYIDSTGQYARITTFMKDIGTDNMKKVEQRLQEKINQVFPKENYTVTLTGKAFVFEKGTHYLIDNLFSSLIFAIFLIAGLMAYLFRSFKMVLISILPNLLPLIMTAGLMGYFGVPLKPSTILVFSIAFGISVDDTIHFLAKYRQELKTHHWRIRKSVFLTIREAGIGMFYTSVVLFFGFSVFTLSNFGGTMALGILIAITLLFAMLSNLILLPTLLLSLDRIIANKKEFVEPTFDILAEDKIEKKV